MTDQDIMRSYHNRMTSAISNVQSQLKDQHVLQKVTHLWLKSTNDIHDKQINLQRVIHILKLESEQRTMAQARFVSKYFEHDFSYIQQYMQFQKIRKIKGQLKEDLYLKLFIDMAVEQFSQFEIVFNHGDTGRKMYFILDGEAAILIPNGEADHHTQRKSIRKYEDVLKYKFSNFKMIAVKKQYDHFGEIAIEQRIPRTATVLTKTDCTFATISYDSYQKVLGEYQEQILLIKQQFIQSIPPFKYWSQSLQSVLLHSCEEVHFETNNLIYKRNTKGDSIYIIIEGEIEVHKWDKIPVESDLNELFVNRNEKQSILGIYSRGQIVGDYEIFVTNMKQNFVTRVTQAKTKLQTRVLMISIGQFIDLIKINDFVPWLLDYFQQKFNKKWINKVAELNLPDNSSPVNNNIKFICSDDGSNRSKRKSNGVKLYRIVNQNQEDSVRQSPQKQHFLTEQSSEGSPPIFSPQSKNMRKFFNSQSILFQKQKTDQPEFFSSTQIIQGIKNKVDRYQDKFDSNKNFDIKLLKTEGQIGSSLKINNHYKHIDKISSQYSIVLKKQKFSKSQSSQASCRLISLPDNAYKFQQTKQSIY
ncbi:hypothetical protein pb186bvf_012846 [Paramecium bursaria]